MRGHIATMVTLSLRGREDYILKAGLPAMAINVLQNKRSGPGAVPGASTINNLADSTVYGGETGSTCVVKA